MQIVFCFLCISSLFIGQSFKTFTNFFKQNGCLIDFLAARLHVNVNGVTVRPSAYLIECSLIFVQQNI